MPLIHQIEQTRFFKDEDSSQRPKLKSQLKALLLDLQLVCNLTWDFM